MYALQVDGGGCFGGDGTSALVLKGVNLTLHSGEVMAILGSKGSGKRALLDVIARRADGRGKKLIKINFLIKLNKILLRSRFCSPQRSSINKECLSATMWLRNSSM